MKVLSGALIALFVSAPVFASVDVKIPDGAGVKIITMVSTGEAVIVATMPDGSMKELAKTTKAQIESEAPVVNVFWNGDDYSDAGANYQANGSVYNGGGHYTTEHHHHVKEVDDYDVTTDDRYPSGSSSNVAQSNRQVQRQQNQRGFSGGPGYGYGGGYAGPGYGPGPQFQQPLPPITRAPYDGYGNGGY